MTASSAVSVICERTKDKCGNPLHAGPFWQKLVLRVYHSIFSRTTEAIRSPFSYQGRIKQFEVLQTAVLGKTAFYSLQARYVTNYEDL